MANCNNGFFDRPAIAQAQIPVHSWCWRPDELNKRFSFVGAGLSKIAAHFISIGRLLCLAFLYRWHFLNKISLDWLLTVTTQPSTSKFSDSPVCGIYCIGYPFGSLLKGACESELDLSDGRQTNKVMFQLPINLTVFFISVFLPDHGIAALPHFSRKCCTIISPRSP